MAQTSPYTFEAVQLFLDDVIYHMQISVDISNNQWWVSVDDVPVYANALNGTDIQQIGFRLGEWYLGSADDQNVLVGLDNIRVTAIPVPEPSAGWLLAATLCGLLAAARRRLCMLGDK